MNRLRPLLLFFALVSLLFAGPAREQGIHKSYTPSCGTWDVVFSPSPNGNGSLVGVAHVPGTVELWSVGNYNANFHWQEWGLTTGAAATNKQAVPPPTLFNHRVQDLGTKTSAASWTLTVTLSLS